MKGKGMKVGGYVMKRVAAGAHLPTPWLFEAAKTSRQCRADYYVDGNKKIRILRKFCYFEEILKSTDLFSLSFFATICEF